MNRRRANPGYAWTVDPVLASGAGVLNDPAWFSALIEQGPAPLARVFGDATDFRLQILISEEASAGAGKGSGPTPRLVRRGFRADCEYFYPASTIKLAGAVAALLTLARLRRETGLPIDALSPLVFHPAFPDQRLEDRDRGSPTGAITVRQEIRKVCLVSDNPAHNRLYTLVGHREINELMWAAGLPSVRINHRLSEPRPWDDQRRTGQVHILVRNPLGGEQVVTLPARSSDLLVDNAGAPGLEVGREHVDGSARIPAPMSFLRRNRISLIDLQNLLVLVTRPDLLPGLPGFDLIPGDRELLWSAMTEFPGQSVSPRYDPGPFPDEFVKPLLPGLRRALGDSVSVTNKVGQAYGFTIENALVRSPRLGRDIFITACLYANSSGVLGADSYDDRSLALPFMAALGEAIGYRFAR